MEKILIIDDDPALIDFLKVLLESEGYETFSAADGKNGLREIGTRQPDLVLLDYQLPDMNGLEVLSQTNQAYEKALVVMLTGKGSEEVAVECMKAGAADYVVKPFDNQRLVSVIRKALRAREGLQRVKSTLIKIRGESRD
jgi:DNA-binding response OmpR family regulator